MRAIAMAVGNPNFPERLRVALESACEAARKSPCAHRHGAVLFSGKRIFADGKNVSTASKDWADRIAGRPLRSLHAEIACLHGVDASLIRGKDLLVVRVSRRGELLLSQPCLACQKILARKGVRRCWFSTNSGVSFVRFLGGVLSGHRRKAKFP